MSYVTIFYRFLITNVRTLTGVFGAFLLIFITMVKNFFKNPWTSKLKLEPPAELTDPKYGVHKYIKVNVSIYLINFHVCTVINVCKDNYSAKCINSMIKARRSCSLSLTQFFF